MSSPDPLWVDRKATRDLMEEITDFFGESDMTKQASERMGLVRCRYNNDPHLVILMFLTVAKSSMSVCVVCIIIVCVSCILEISL